jgi:hypothetical protein
MDLYGKKKKLLLQAVIFSSSQTIKSMPPIKEVVGNKCYTTTTSRAWLS